MPRPITPSVKNGGDDGTRTRDLCRDRARNPLQANQLRANLFTYFTPSHTVAHRKPPLRAKTDTFTDTFFAWAFPIPNIVIV